MTGAEAAVSPTDSEIEKENGEDGDEGMDSPTSSAHVGAPPPPPPPPTTTQTLTPSSPVRNDTESPIDTIHEVFFI